MMLKIEVGKDKIIYFNREDGKMYLNEKEISADISPIDDKNFHLIFKNQGYSVEVLEIKKEEKKFTFRINGQIIESTVKDKLDILIEKLGFKVDGGNKLNSINAPMPGLLINILVTPGQQVNQGEPLLILEAMKMENIIKSPGNGIVKTVKVKTGDTVEKNQILMEFE